MLFSGAKSSFRKIPYNLFSISIICTAVIDAYFWSVEYQIVSLQNDIQS